VWAYNETDKEATSLMFNPNSKVLARVYWASAFDVAELGEMLPDIVDEDTENELTLHFSKTDNAFGEGKTLWFPNIIDANLQQGFTTEAIAKAEVLLWLIATRPSYLKGINERLQGIFT
jgi:hypothetical protein